MTRYRLFGAETSPYSLKVRAALRYKGVDFDWVSRSSASEAEFQSLAAQPTVPLLIAPGRPVSQDSTGMLATLEADRPEPATAPDDPACAALALLLEDYADEWLNKAMFQARWSQSPDREAAARRLMAQLFGDHAPKDEAAAIESIAQRMAGRLPLVGAGGRNADVIQASFERFATLLDAHLKTTLFLFGGRPSAADFAIAGQTAQMLADPTPGAWLRANAPFLTEWSEFMDQPVANGPFQPLDALAPTLLPLLRDEVAITYLPWALANAESVSRRRKKVKVEIAGTAYEQTTQKYAARAFRAVRASLRSHAEAPGLLPLLEEAGLTPLLD